jgi:predicted RNA-binding Zn ribbon-like protein
MTQTTVRQAPRAETMLVSRAGEAICLGFANTLAWRGRAAPIEALRDFGALLAWAETSAALPAQVAKALAEWASDQPSQSEEALAEAIAMREAIYRLASAVACGAAANDCDFAVLSDALALAPARQRLARLANGFAWQIDLGNVAGTGLPIPVLLAPVLWSAGDLMVGSARRRIRQCANDQCLWLFVDSSKSGTRRWCDMAACGNRAKARRHYLKTKQG